MLRWQSVKINAEDKSHTLLSAYDKEIHDLRVVDVSYCNAYNRNYIEPKKYGLIFQIKYKIVGNLC